MGGHVLAIDTSTSRASVALCREDGALELMLAAGEAVERGRAGRDVLPWAERLLGHLGATAADLVGVAVARGPGSFTGVRIGVATALGIALGVPCPVVGISTLEAMLRQASLVLGSARRPVAVVPAGRGRLYVGYREAGGASGGLRELLVASSRLRSRLPFRRGVALVGEGSEDLLPRLGLAAGVALGWMGPLAPAVGLVAAEALASGDSGDPGRLRAVYLQPSGALTPARRARRAAAAP